MNVYGHGAPGPAPEDRGVGLSAAARPLVSASQKWTAAEPAWRLSEDDHDLRAIVAFLEQMPTLAPRAHQAMERAAEAREQTQGIGG